MTRRRLVMMWTTLFALLVAGSAQATVWDNEFADDPAGTGPGAPGGENFDPDVDGGATSASFTTAGTTPILSFTVTFEGTGGAAPKGTGWLTQGLRGGTPTTAKFSHPGVGGSGGGRARFAAPLPSTFDADGGVAFAWKARYGNYAIGRGPVQIGVTDNGDIPIDDGGTGIEQNVYIRVQNGTNVDILRNGGGAYTDIGTYVLPGVGVGDGQFHEWAVSMITDFNGVGHWNLWLDGEKLLFETVAFDDPDMQGAHLYNGQEYSFATFSDTSFSGSPYIGLGELNTQEVWDFEFDCVAMDDAPAFPLETPLSCGTTISICESDVIPSDLQISTAFKAGPATPPTHTYTVVNPGTQTVNYTVEETDAGGGSLDYPFLSLSKSAGTIPEGGEDAVVATIIDTDLAAGTHTAYITFTDDCDPANQHIRQIDLIITDCQSDVWPAGEVARSVNPGSPEPVADAVFTITNTGRDGLTYDVAEDPDCPWLVLSQSSGGPLNNGVSDQVTASIDATGLPTGVHTCSIRFTNTTPDCTNTPADHLRTVVLHVIGAATGRQQFDAEFTTFTGSDLNANSPMGSCDPDVTTTREFFISYNDVAALPAGWLTQGSIDGIPTTANFSDPADGNRGRARFRAFLPFDETFDPALGMVVAWSMRVGNYAVNRGPIQITFPRVPGPFGTDDLGTATDGDEFNVFVRLQNGNRVNILRNGGGAAIDLDTLILPNSIAGEFHQWTAAACVPPLSGLAFWNLWIDGEQLLFGGANGSVVGPGGKTYSFRTPLEDVSGDPYVGLGDIGLPTPDVLDFEFDWVRMMSYGVDGCPFWDGEGCVPAPICGIPFADSDEDGDVDGSDFSDFQLCYTGANNTAAFDPDNCGCFDRDRDNDIDALDFAEFEFCSSGPDVPWQPSVECP